MKNKKSKEPKKKVDIVAIDPNPGCDEGERIEAEDKEVLPYD